MFRRIYKLIIDRRKRAWNRRHAKRIEIQQARFRAEAHYLADEYEKRFDFDEMRKSIVNSSSLPANLEISFLRSAFVNDFVFYYGKGLDLDNYVVYYTYKEEYSAL